MKRLAVGYGDSGDEAIEEWKTRIIESQGKVALEGVETHKENKKIRPPTRRYGRRWEIPYQDNYEQTGVFAND